MWSRSFLQQVLLYNLYRWVVSCVLLLLTEPKTCIQFKRSFIFLHMNTGAAITAVCLSTLWKVLTAQAVPTSKFLTRVKFPLCLQHRDMKAYVEADANLHSFLTSALQGGQSARFGRFTPRERAHDTHWIGGWVDPGIVLACQKRENTCPFRKF